MTWHNKKQSGSQGRLCHVHVLLGCSGMESLTNWTYSRMRLRRPDAKCYDRQKERGKDRIHKNEALQCGRTSPERASGAWRSA